MDDERGEEHPEIIATWWRQRGQWDVAVEIIGHSRFHAAKYGWDLSPLFRADKLAVALYPGWLYLLLGNMSGEIKEYMEIAKNKEGKYIDLFVNTTTQAQWLLEVKAHMIMMGLKGGDYEPVKKQMKEGVQHEIGTGNSKEVCKD
jgi:hypothetical protein